VVTRRSSADVAAEAEGALVDALREALGSSVGVATGPARGADIIVSLPHGGTVAVEVKAVAQRAEPGRIADALNTWESKLASVRDRTSAPVVGVVVAAAVPEPTKTILREHGWGWLDRRGELDLRGPGLVVHTTDISPSTASTPSSPRDPIQGRAGITTAACLLMADHDHIPGVREIARRGDLAPSTVSTTLAALRRASLVDDEGRPLVPELFWALAGAWKPERHAFADIPARGSRLELGLNSLDDPGWAVANTVAAAAWGAPVVVGSAAPPDFYVPSTRDLRSAQRELPTARTAEERRCTVAVAPTALVVRPRYDATSMSTSWLHWPVVHPLFVALDLSLDRARGTEILQDWDVPEPFRKVW